MPKKVTLKDVAALTGVTTASVSMILNGKDLNRFTPETVTRVIAAAQTLGYVSPSARHEQKQIAILSPSVNNPYHTTIIMGIERAALASGYHLQHLLESADGADAAAAAGKAPRGRHHLRDESAAGGKGARDRPAHPGRRRRRYRERHRHRHRGREQLPRRRDRGGALYQIGPQAHRLSHHLAQRPSHRARAPVRGAAGNVPPPLPRGQRDGLCKENQLEQEIQSPDIELESGKELARECMQHPEITGIVAINDMVGFGVLDGLLEAGKRVPEDYSLCGFDNVFPSGFQRMQLTTVDHGTIYHGARAFHLLKDRMETAWRPSARTARPTRSQGWNTEASWWREGAQPNPENKSGTWRVESGDS